ncbi:MAG: hypothetical protein E6J43_02660 [Chloroflexi bacterium]|nr:MAG: hypothetical protein E6J43_02660 [Chloroflexota bacterium]
MPSGWPSSIEGYVKGDVGFELYLLVSNALYSRNYLVVVQRAWENLDLAFAFVDDEIAIWNEYPADDRGEAMLVIVPEAIEHPEPMRAVAVRSIVGLHAFDDCLHLRRKLEESRMAGDVFRFGGIEREGASSTGWPASKLPVQIVEGSPEVMDEITDKEAEFIGRGAVYLDPEVVEASITLTLGDNLIRPAIRSVNEA